MPIATAQSFNAMFERVKTRFDRQHRPDGLICKQGFYSGSYVLKLQKASWTNDPMDQTQNESGIFFSIWVSAPLIKRNRVNYNIHALKLRQLKGYSITSRDFAAEFRSAFAEHSSKWPNVSVDYGPLTLMEGWIVIEPDILERDVVGVMNQFESLSQLIDRLLKARRRT